MQFFPPPRVTNNYINNSNILYHQRFELTSLTTHTNPSIFHVRYICTYIQVHIYSKNNTQIWIANIHMYIRMYEYICTIHAKHWYVCTYIVYIIYISYRLLLVIVVAIPPLDFICISPPTFFSAPLCMYVCTVQVQNRVEYIYMYVWYMYAVTTI